MACVTTAKHGQTFNKKSSIIVNTNGNGKPSLWDTRVNDLVPTTATSGQIETKLDTAYDEVYYYVSGGNY